MIYTAGYDYPEHHHGRLVPLTRRYPFRVWRNVPPEDQRHTRPIIEQSRKLNPANAKAVDWLIPTKELAQIYKELGESAFTEGYRIQIKHNLEAILEYLSSCEPDADETWLTRAGPGEFSHRNLALKLVERYRPDCYGGADVPLVYQPSLLETES